jgi:hypothetical protein
MCPEGLPFRKNSSKLVGFPGAGAGPSDPLCWAKEKPEMARSQPKIQNFIDPGI